MEGNGRIIGIEVKSFKASKIIRGFMPSIEDVKAYYGWVISWLDYKTLFREDVFQSGLNELLEFMEKKQEV